jgi:Arrestin (or S-antigen), N-terminal domain
LGFPQRKHFTIIMMGKDVFGIALAAPGKFHAGVSSNSKLTGTIRLDFATDTKGSEITLEFSGREQTLVRHRREENNDNAAITTSSDYYMRATSNRTLILVNLPPVDCSSLVRHSKDQTMMIAAGQYELPFTIDLPNILPSSCRAEYDGSYCEIVYFLKAELQGSGVVQNYQAQIEVPVAAAPLTREPIPYVVPPEMESINMLCCFPQGTITVAARVADTKLDRGEILNVGLACRNNSSSTIAAITITLHQECEWEAERYRQLQKDVLGSVKTPRSLSSRVVWTKQPCSRTWK